MKIAIAEMINAAINSGLLMKSASAVFQAGQSIPQSWRLTTFATIETDPVPILGNVTLESPKDFA
jgi:hypothetical protein